jgi:hypothetical protein
VRQLKASKADKSVINAAVAELLELKKKLAELESKKSGDSATPSDLESLTKQVTEQVRHSKLMQ